MKIKKLFSDFKRGFFGEKNDITLKNSSVNYPEQLESSGSDSNEFHKAIPVNNIITSSTSASNQDLDSYVPNNDILEISPTPAFKNNLNITSSVEDEIIEKTNNISTISTISLKEKKVKRTRFTLADIDTLTLEDIEKIKAEQLPIKLIDRKKFIELLKQRLTFLNLSTTSETQNSINHHQNNNVNQNTILPNENDVKHDFIIKTDSIDKSKKLSRVEKVFQENYYQYKVENLKKLKNLQKVFCLYPSTSESFVAFLNKQKVTIFINGIHHETENTEQAKLCKKYLEHNIKKKNIYIEVLETLSDGSLVAEVYGDSEKRYKLTDFLAKYNLTQSNLSDLEDTPFEEPNFQSFSNNQSTHKQEFSSFCDMQPSKPPESDNSSVSSNNDDDNRIKDKENEQNLFKKYNQARESGALIGYVKDFGVAPYNFIRGNNNSYYLTLQLATKESILWGVGLEKDLLNENVIPGSFIKIKKVSETIRNSNQKYERNFFEIDILQEKADLLFQNNFFEKLLKKIQDNQKLSNIEKSIYKQIKSNYDNDSDSLTTSKKCVTPSPLSSFDPSSAISNSDQESSPNISKTSDNVSSHTAEPNSLNDNNHDAISDDFYDKLLGDDTPFHTQSSMRI